MTYGDIKATNLRQTHIHLLSILNYPQNAKIRKQKRRREAWESLAVSKAKGSRGGPAVRGWNRRCATNEHGVTTPASPQAAGLDQHSSILQHTPINMCYQSAETSSDPCGSAGI